MKVIYENLQGAQVYGIELELKGKTVHIRQLNYASGAERKFFFPESKNFASEELAAKYFRYKILKHQNLNYKLTQGQEPDFVSNESFIDVKDKTEAYRYFENPKKGTFADIDLDSVLVIVTKGKIGTQGEEECEEFSWDGDAENAYEEKIETLKKEGFVLKTNSSLGGKEEINQVEVPKVYKDFLDKNKYQKYQNKVVSDLPTYTEGTQFKLKFKDPGLSSKLAGTNFDQKKHPSFIALSALGEEPGLLMVDTGKEACPVYLFMTSESEMHLVNSSFQNFLKSLKEPSGKKAGTVKAKAIKHVPKITQAKPVKKNAKKLVKKK